MDLWKIKKFQSFKFWRVYRVWKILVRRLDKSLAGANRVYKFLLACFTACSFFPLLLRIYLILKFKVSACYKIDLTLLYWIFKNTWHIQNKANCGLHCLFSLWLLPLLCFCQILVWLFEHLARRRILLYLKSFCQIF